MTLRRAPWLLLWAALLGCGAPGDLVQLRFRVEGAPLVAAEVRYEPAAAVSSARLGPSALSIARRRADRALEVRVPGYCPVTIPAGPQRAPQTLTPLIDLGGDRAPLGFDAPFVIAVKHGCPERGRGRITWQQRSGPPLAELRVEDDGFRLHARTAKLSELQPGPLPPGVVRFSPRTQGRVQLVARWQRDAEPALERELSLTATSRASGLSSVAVSQQLVLGRADYQVQSAPRGGHATALAQGEVTVFTPDAPGRWVLARPDGASVTLAALTHDRTPYDCGRSECHAQLSASAQDSPMSHALERPLSASAADGCMLDCHVLGERGLSDGGFLALARDLDFGGVEGARWQDLPRTLRRAGGVRCTACHGPGAIPPPETRDAILRADVCATCHDAPPRYPHMEAWRASRMARADEAPATRQGTCAQCHTTRGFLAALGVRALHAGQSDDEPAGIACAACHAPHAAQHGARLVRDLAAPAESAAQPTAATRLCLQCHASASEAPQPAGALLLGRARVPLADGSGWQELRGEAAHGAIAGGCIGCHGAPPAQGGKLDHAFRASEASCKPCHATDAASQLKAADDALAQRAARLREKLAGPCDLPAAGPPLHALTTAPSCDTPRHARALYELGLVLEDPAAAQHNAAFARALLTDAEQQL